ncbi:MAG: hypothetical protein ABIJ57_00215 [Pseudomonadota bacterium]
MRLNFGAFRGHELSDPSVPDSYVKWLALRGSYQEPGNCFVTRWKVPIDLSIEARREMEIRGYRRVDDGYEKEGR